MPRPTPLVSVCIPTYNRAAGLRRAVRAVLDGDFRDIEVIISDNASQDDTEAAGRELEATDKRVRYFRHDRNMGPTANFEFARAQASGKYFVWCGDDDYFAQDYIRCCVEPLERDDGLLLAAGLGAYHRGDGKTVYYGNKLRLDSPHPVVRVAEYLFKVRDNSVFYGLYRREAVAASHLSNALGNDWMWLTDILLLGRAAVVPGAFVHRCFGDSTSSSYARIVTTIGAPAWQARHPFLAIAGNFRRHLYAAPALREQPLWRLLAATLLAAAAMLFRALRKSGKKTLLRVPLLGSYLNRVLDPY
jgi:glycosyltransferase involved in cell wall biosynthesis